MSHNSERETLVQCPFDKNHQIMAYKLHIHLLKCRKNHPELDRTLERCPFNVTHLFLPSEKEQHILECPDRKNILNRGPAVPRRPPSPEREIVSRPPIPVDEENWDDDLAQQPIFENKAKSSNRPVETENGNREKKIKIEHEPIDSPTPSPPPAQPTTSIEADREIKKESQIEDVGNEKTTSEPESIRRPVIPIRSGMGRGLSLRKLK